MTKTKADETEIFFPEREVMNGDRRIVVHEFSFAESLRATAVAAGILADLAQLFASGDDQHRPGYEDMAEIFSRHQASYMTLISMATGLTTEEIASLPGDVGDELSLTFWTVNKGFFTRRLVLRAMRRRVPAEEAPSASPSSPAS